MEVFCALDTRPKYHQVVAAIQINQLVPYWYWERERVVTHRNCGMLWCFARHQIEYLLLDIRMCAMRTIARPRAANVWTEAMLWTGRTGHLVLLLLRLLLAPLHRTLILRHNAFGSHAHGQALLQSTLLALASHVHVHFAGTSKFAAVDRIFSDTPPKESLATLAGECIVMIARRPIAADEAQFLLQSRRRTLLALLGIASLVHRVTVQAARGRQIVTACKDKKIKIKINI